MSRPYIQRVGAYIHKIRSTADIEDDLSIDDGPDDVDQLDVIDDDVRRVLATGETNVGIIAGRCGLYRKDVEDSLRRICVDT